MAALLTLKSKAPEILGRGSPAGTGERRASIRGITKTWD
jgi:hypothetical protein